MAVRFFRRGVSAVKFLPAVAGASPTRPEITAGTDLTAQVADINGFQLKNNPITTPDLSTTFDSQIDGPDGVDDSSLVMYDLSDSAAIRTALAKGTNGFLVLFPYGDVTSKRCEVWPVRSTGVNDQWSLSADPARYMVGFAVTAKPTQNATTP